MANVLFGYEGSDGGLMLGKICWWWHNFLEMSNVFGCQLHM